MKKKQICEFGKCKKIGKNADTMFNMWLCDDHYSKIDDLVNQCETEEQLDDLFFKIDCLSTFQKKL
jgi:DNA-directed RNA polymerase sigma subunit (sigma70/sigma32)